MKKEDVEFVSEMTDNAFYSAKKLVDLCDNKYQKIFIFILIWNVTISILLLLK